jgi:hypothetical protein
VITNGTVREASTAKEPRRPTNSPPPEATNSIPRPCCGKTIYQA